MFSTKSPVTIAIYLLLLCCTTVKGQIYFFENDRLTPGDGVPVKIYADSSSNRSFNRFLQIQNHLQLLGKNNINLSYKNEMLWIRIPLAEIANKPAFNKLMIRNPHINFLKLWIVKGDSIVNDYPLTGDRMPFNNRVLKHPDFVYPLPTENRKELSVLLLIDKRNEQLNIPLHWLTDEGFSDYNRKKNIIAGLMTGIALFLFLFSFFLFYNMQERLYVYYGLYIFTVFFYVFSDFGYSFMYFFPNNPAPADFTRPMAITLASPLYLIFSLQLLQVKEKLPVAYSWSKRYLIFYLLVFIISVLVMPNTGTIRTILVGMMQGFQSITAFWVLVIAIRGVQKKIPYAAYVVVASMVLMISFFLFMQFVSGYITDTFFTRNLMNIGFTSEMCILAFVLTLRFKNYKIQSEELLRSTNVQQELIFKNISDYQERERERYSSLLHDSVGARLSAIRLNLEYISRHDNPLTATEKLHKSIYDISELANEVRQFSHSLSPLLLQKKGLVQSLTDYIEDINSNGQLFIQFESIGSLQATSFRYELMVYNIIQELIHNCQKHSGATEMIIQIILEKEIISLFVEDNGKGFDQNLIKEGLGFSQIKQLVTFVKGTVKFRSEKNKGYSVSIEFPVLADETTNPPPNS